jgi:pimeloyl-[acyl-carrier protein] methyl ester esterase
MTLAVSVAGSGPDLVLLHGWGMHSAIWSGLIPLLSDQFTLHLVDLPGHGDSEFENQDTLTDWAEAVLSVAPQNASWIGWSLGGLVAMQAALLQPSRLNKLVLFCSTPRFVAGSDWPHAVDSAVLQEFSHQFELDYPNTLKRFLALQVLGSRQSGQVLRDLRHCLLEKQVPDASALQVGLSILRSADFRANMNNFPVPLYWLLADRDTLVPPQVAAHYPDIPKNIIMGAGHAPFISHPEPCAHTIKNWLRIEAQQAGHGG